VLELNKELESMREQCHPNVLEHSAFSYATSSVLKRFNDPECRGKSELIHVYRELVSEGKITHDQNIENMMVKKLSKSLFGGINLSIFIPPGHTAPFWTVNIILISRNIVRVSVAKKKSAYDLLMYASYVNVKSEETAIIGGKYEVLVLEANSMDVSLIGTTSTSGRKNREKHVWDLDELSQCVNIETETETSSYPQTLANNVVLKGTLPIKTCTFGCVYCPTETTKEGQQANPKSYLTHEPGVLRAVRNGYDTASQVYDRVTSLREMGHNCSKVFVRCVGGTWSVVTKVGQKTFVRDILYALNTMDAPLSRDRLTLKEEQIFNETASCRAVEICVEDHPKMVSTASLTFARELGVTALEMGVQTTNDEIHRLTKRDSTRAELIDRAALAKDFGFKVMAHIMPDLPGSTPEIDRTTIDDIVNRTEHLRIRANFSSLLSTSFLCTIFAVALACTTLQLGTPGQIDAWGVLLSMAAAGLAALMLQQYDQRYHYQHYFLFDYDRYKLYPTMVLEFSELKEWYADGRYTPYWQSIGPEALYSVIQYFLEQVKPYQRVERVIRDVPASRQHEKGVNYVVGGVNVTNAQQIVFENMKRENKKCVCLRTREIRDGNHDPRDAQLFVHQYFANRGEEFFLSFETPCRSKVFGFLKLRFNNGPGREKERSRLPAEIRGKEVAMIRWLQVYGRAIAIGGGTEDRSSQHVGFGKRLMERAEEIARKKGATRLCDISGIGVREYYRKMGYVLEGTYMIKHL
jgi:elongator complex protein 3